MQLEPAPSTKDLFIGTPIVPLQFTYARHTYTKLLQQSLKDFPSTFVGDHIIRGLPNTLIANFQDMEAWNSVPRDFVDNIIFLSHKAALLHTSISAQQWSDFMTTQNIQS